MSEKYKILDPAGKYFITLTVISWIDLFTRKELKYVVLQALAYCQRNKGLQLHAWVLMSSHLHLIVSTNDAPLEAIVRDFKKFTSKEIIRVLKNMNESRKAWLLRAFKKAAEKVKRVNQYKVWQDGYHPVLLQTNTMLDQRLQYIHQNPVEAEWVDEPEYYWYSSARDYAGQKGLLQLELLY